MPVLAPKDKFEKELDDKYSDLAAFDTDKTFKELTDPEHFNKNAEDPQDQPKYTSDQDEKGGKSSRRRFRGRYSKPLIAATAIGGAGTIAWFSFMSGPGQFIHAAQLLQQFHFTSNEDASTSRATRLWRYAKNPNDPGKRRLSGLGNRLADAMDAAALAHGFEFFDKSPSGQARKLSVDTKKYGKSIDEVFDEFKKAGYEPYRVNLDDGIIYFEVDNLDLNIRKDRRLMKIVSRGSGVNRVVGAVGFRKVKIRNLIGLGVVRNLEQKAVDKGKTRYNEWRENRRERIATRDPGSAPVGSATNDSTTDAPKAGAPEAAGTNFNKADIQTKAARGVGIVGLVTGVGCAAVAIADQVDSESYELVQVPLMKSAMEMMSYAGMIMSGTATEDTWEELGYASQAFTQEAVEAGTGGSAAGAVKASSWLDAEDVTTELGEPTDGTTPPPKEVYIDPDGNVVSQVVDSIPGIRGACGAASSIPGQIIFTVADVVSSASLVGPLAGQAVTLLFADDFLDALLGWFGGDPVDIQGAAGAKYGSYLNFGTFYSANESAIAQGGRALSRPEVAELKLKERQELINIANEKGLFYKTLDKNNPRSVVSSFARQAPDSVSQLATTLFTSPFKILSSLRTFIPGTATYAAGAGFDYGLPKYGFSLTELENDDYDNPYENANNFSDAKLEELRDEWGEKCFGVKIFEDTGRLEFSSGKPYKDIIDDCPPLKEGAVQSEEFTRYRMYILDTVTAYSGACYGGDEEACASLGFGGVSGNSATASLDGVECPSNLEAHPTAAGYFKMPDAPGGEYAVVTSDRYGSQQLVCVLHSVGMAYGEQYQGKSRLIINDLTAASGHQTHKTGINVDVNAGGDTAAANHTVSAVGAYSAEHTITLGKMFIDTKVIKTILWCESPGDGTTKALQDYATQLGLKVDIRCYPGHKNHFHVTVLDSNALPELY